MYHIRRGSVQLAQRTITRRGPRRSGVVLNKPNQSGICVITFPSRAGVFAITKVVETLLPYSKEIFMIGGGLSNLDDPKIHIIRLHQWSPGKSTPYKIMALILSQLGTSFNLVKLSKNFEILIVYDIAQLQVIPLILAKMLRKNVIMYYAGSFEIYFKILSSGKMLAFGRILAFIAKLLARVTCILSDVIILDTERVIEQFGLSRVRSKVHICPYSYVDTNIFKVTKDLQDRRNLVGFVGRISQEKGATEFTKAIPIVLAERNDVEFLICGDGPLLHRITQQLKSSEVSSKITILGAIPTEKVAECLNELKLLVIPSIQEGIPKTLLEAAACGTPVLATPAGGIPDFIKDGETGFILNDNSPQCIAQGIIQSLNHPNLGAIAENARAPVEKECGYEAVVKKWSTIFASLTPRQAGRLSNNNLGRTQRQ
jgi:glycosyltransferase involved in cell wall biosynthesis